MATGTRKERLTVTIDGESLKAARGAVAAGRAGSVSAWVNAALRERLDRERRLAAMARAVEMFEAEHGPISAEEIERQERADKLDAIAISPARGRASSSRARRPR